MCVLCGHVFGCSPPSFSGFVFGVLGVGVLVFVTVVPLSIPFSVCRGRPFFCWVCVCVRVVFVVCGL